MGARISSVGIALPEREVTSAELAGMLDVSESWIVDRTGIKSRRVASDGDTVSGLGLEAARNALGSDPVDVDLVICATVTAEARFPATACLIAAGLGMGSPAYDVNAGCSGFLFALAQAEATIAAGAAARVLVVGAEVMSRIVDPGDPKTAILFGDGAGAALVERAEERALGPFTLFSDGSQPELLATDKRGLVTMQGREVYRHAVTAMSTAIASLLAREDSVAADVDLVIAHQANQRILDAVAGRLGLRDDQVFSNIARYGNTSAASIPLALYEAQSDGYLTAGSRIVLTAFGAGFCWGAGLASWVPTPNAQHASSMESIHV